MMSGGRKLKRYIHNLIYLNNVLLYFFHTHVLVFKFQDITGCGKFRKLGLQNEEELQKCFGDITSVGADHWSPHMTNAKT